MKKFSKLALATAVAALTSTGAYAFNQGALGNATSEGDITVQIQKDTLVQVNGITGDNIYPAAATFANIPSPTLSQSFCVFSSTGSFDVSFRGLNADFLAGTAFNMYNGDAPAAATDYVVYTVDFTNTTGAVVNGAANDGNTTHYGTFTTGGADLNCANQAGGVNSTVSTTIDQPTFDAADNNSTYTDILYMLFTAI